MSGAFTWVHHLFSPINSTGGFILAALICTALFVAVMSALHQLSPHGKKWLTIGCTFLAGLYFLIEYLWPTHTNPVTGSQETFLTSTITPVSQYINYVFMWTVLMGLISLMIVHGRRLFARRPGWHNSIAFFLALIAMMVAGLWSQMGQSVTAPGAVKFYTSLFDGLLVNLDAAMFSLLAFYIASAAYRAFRVRTLEAGLLMVAALVVMLGMVNFGVLLTDWIPTHSNWAFFRFEKLSMWIMYWINMPAQRAVTIGVAVGALAMAMRLWLSLERGSFFSQE